MRNGLSFSILMVDDDEDDRFVFDEAFKEVDFEAEVKKFIDGARLIRYLESIDASLYPQLIVLDNTLPKLDATDLLSILQNHPSYKDIRIIIYTSSLTAAKKEQLLQAGAYRCIEKGLPCRTWSR